MTRSSPPQDNGARPVGGRHWRPWRLAAIGALWLAVVAAAGAYFWLRPPGPQPSSASTSVVQLGGPFNLVDPAGRPVTDRDFRGKFMLIYFGYTHCPDVCPTTLLKVAAALETLGPRGRPIQPIFITVDPLRDTPAVTGAYAAHFNPRILGLSGSLAQITAVEKAYGVYSSANATPAQLDAAIDHSSILYLMGPNGRFVAPIATDGVPNQMAADIDRYLSS